MTIRRVTDGAAHALNVTPARGALVVAIDENGPAEAAGIEPADVIVRVDGKDVKECRDLPRIVAGTTAADVALTIIRKKELTRPSKSAGWRMEARRRRAGRGLSEVGGRAKHPAPGMAMFEFQQQPVSSDPLLLMPCLPVWEATLIMSAGKSLNSGRRVGGTGDLMQWCRVLDRHHHSYRQFAKRRSNLRTLSAQGGSNSDSSTSMRSGGTCAARKMRRSSARSGLAKLLASTAQHDSWQKRQEIYTSHYRRCGQETNSIPVRLHAMPASHSIFRKNCAIHTGTIEYQLIRGGRPNSK